MSHFATKPCAHSRTYNTGGRHSCYAPQGTRHRQCARGRPHSILAVQDPTASDAEPPVIFENDPDVIKWTGELQRERVIAPIGANPIVILPGFGNCTADYIAPFGDPKDALATHLRARGFKVYVVPLERKAWFRVARALLTLKFWRGQCTTAPGYTWYLDRVAETVATALEETAAEQVDLVGHSAGGWLGRAFLADPKYQEPAEQEGQPQAQPRPNRRVRALVTLGTPQMAPPPEKMRDMTGGCLTWVNNTYPGAFFASQGVRYVCAAGRSVRGNAAAPRGKGVRTPGNYAYNSYNAVCGEGDGVIGDAVVPLSSALLEGATNVVLDGVWHSMSRIGTFEEPSQVVWYGSDAVLDCWLHPLVDGTLGEPVIEPEAIASM